MNNYDSSPTIVSCEICESYSFKELRKTVENAVLNAGGWPQKVGSARKILLKPNLLSASSPEEAVTTHPEFIRAVICEIRRHADPEIVIGDSPAGDYPWDELWEKTGLKRIAHEEDVELLPFTDIKRREISGFGFVPALKELEDFDAVISLPKLKTHVLTKITGAVKNVYGLVPGNAKSGFHGEHPSPGKMADFIAAFYASCQPDFNIMDAVDCMEGNGPSNGRPLRSGLIFAGADAIALDCCACEIYGYRPSDIKIITLAMKYCGKDPDFCNAIQRKGDGWNKMKGIRAGRSSADFLNWIPEFMFHSLSLVLRCRPIVDNSLCIRCGICEKACSQKAISRKGNSFRISQRKCIVCMCCMESCPKHAVELVSPGIRTAGKIRQLFKNVDRKKTNVI